MVRKLAVRSLRHGIGSISYVHTLMIMKDDLDDESEIVGEFGDQSSAEHANRNTTATQSIDPCCGTRTCISMSPRFAKLCLHPDVLEPCVYTIPVIFETTERITVHGPLGELQLHHLPWPRDTTYDTVFGIGVQYVTRKYGQATIACDGYESDASTKDCTHLKRAEVGSPTVKLRRSHGYVIKEARFPGQ